MEIKRAGYRSIGANNTQIGLCSPPGCVGKDCPSHIWVKHTVGEDSADNGASCCDKACRHKTTKEYFDVSGDLELAKEAAGCYGEYNVKYRRKGALNSNSYFDLAVRETCALHTSIPVSVQRSTDA